MSTIPTKSANTSPPVHENSASPPSVDDIRRIDISEGVKTVEGSAGRPNGSSVKHLYKHRTTCYYPVTADELDQISAFNKVSTGLFSAASFVFGFTADAGRDLFTSADLEQATKENLWIVVAAGTVIGLACAALGVLFLKMKSQQSDRIKSEASDDA